ncbi:unnamed protein product [Didymodactylos carnosus]|uniref:NAD(P)(+)--arginine ADP-ribosyltransferase n=1 Tax=Didymodactylos carnosus TaxID=1234261 RepID=A0A815H550_9BILA|nr:unnamed protein product [Didymodactylos carnosus]CAF4214136.1 unnamed protein product [Didymodactylos carnosus]
MTAISDPNIKFSCITSRFLCPTFRRPNYRRILSVPLQDIGELIPKEQLFHMWTKEKGQYYHFINSALLEDDHQVLEDNLNFIFSLKHAIKSNSYSHHGKVYRGLELDDEQVKEEYKIGTTFLWPTFTCTSKDKEQAGRFGHYLFEIDIPGEGITYCCDISQYSDFPYESEVLFYPYTGFRVTQVLPEKKLIKLTCVDTLTIEKENEKLIPDQVKIYDEFRDMYVWFYKSDTNIYWCNADDPETIYIIAQNDNGYWDSPYRFHHKNGYFLKRSLKWEEYQDNEKICEFREVNELVINDKHEETIQKGENGIDMCNRNSRARSTETIVNKDADA